MEQVDDQELLGMLRHSNPIKNVGISSVLSLKAQLAEKLLEKEKKYPAAAGNEIIAKPIILKDTVGKRSDLTIGSSTEKNKGVSERSAKDYSARNDEGSKVWNYYMLT